LPPHSFAYTHTSPSRPYSLSLHDALPISGPPRGLTTQIGDMQTPYLKARLWSSRARQSCRLAAATRLCEYHPTHFLIHEWCQPRSEEHTSELQSRFDLVCRLLLEKKKQIV